MFLIDVNTYSCMNQSSVKHDLVNTEKIWSTENAVCFSWFTIQNSTPPCSFDMILNNSFTISIIQVWDVFETQLWVLKLPLYMPERTVYELDTKMFEQFFSAKLTAKCENSFASANIQYFYIKYFPKKFPWIVL